MKINLRFKLLIAVMSPAIVMTLGALSAKVALAEDSLAIATPQFISEWGSSGASTDQFNFPRALTVDSAGNVYVADSGNSAIKKFDKNGFYLTQWGLYRYTYAPGTFGGLCGLNIDSSGNIYVSECADARQHVQKFSSTGEFLAVIGGSRGLDEGQFFSGGQNDIAIDSADNVYILDASGRQIGNYGVHVFLNDGAFIKRWGQFGDAPLREVYGDGELRNPYGIAIDSHDNVYITDQSRQIKKFTKDGVFITKWGIDEFGQNIFRNPMGLAVDNNDNVYVVDLSSNEIQVFNSNGNFLFRWGSQGSGEGQFIQPYDIAIYDNYVFVADGGNNRIQKFITCSQDVWSCSDWGICSLSGSQARICAKTFDCPLIETPSPETIQACVPPDREPPQINIISPTSSSRFFRSQVIIIDYTAEDNLFGVATTTMEINGQVIATTTIDLFDYPAGQYQLKITASDLAGNVSSSTADFEIITDIPHCLADLNSFYQEKIISREVRNKLSLPLEQLSHRLRATDLFLKLATQAKEKIENNNRLKPKDKEKLLKKADEGIRRLLVERQRLIIDKLNDLDRKLNSLLRQNKISQKVYDIIKADIDYLRNNL